MAAGKQPYVTGAYDPNDEARLDDRHRLAPSAPPDNPAFDLDPTKPQWILNCNLTDGNGVPWADESQSAGQDMSAMPAPSATTDRSLLPRPDVVASIPFAWQFEVGRASYAAHRGGLRGPLNSHPVVPHPYVVHQGSWSGPFASASADSLFEGSVPSPSGADSHNTDMAQGRYDVTGYGSLQYQYTLLHTHPASGGPQQPTLIHPLYQGDYGVGALPTYESSYGPPLAYTTYQTTPYFWGGATREAQGEPGPPAYNRGHGPEAIGAYMFMFDASQTDTSHPQSSYLHGEGVSRVQEQPAELNSITGRYHLTQRDISDASVYVGSTRPAGDPSGSRIGVPGRPVINFLAEDQDVAETRQASVERHSNIQGVVNSHDGVGRLDPHGVSSEMDNFPTVNGYIPRDEASDE